MVISKRAWIITWEPITKENREGYNVVTILNYKTSDGIVRERLEQLYVDFMFSPSERLAYAKSKKSKSPTVQFDNIKGTPWWGRMTCGYNPFLYARQVSNIKVREDKNGIEFFEWEEIDKPNIHFK